MGLPHRANVDKTNAMQMAGHATEHEKEQMQFWLNNRDASRHIEEARFWMALAPRLFARSQGRRHV